MSRAGTFRRVYKLPMNTLQQVSQKQLELAQRLYGEHTEYARLLKAYELWAKVNLCQKHSTHDSVFFIINEGIGFVGSFALSPNFKCE